jgi:serine/threonine protein kinase
MRYGRYEVIRELGHGGMASVYLARDPVIGRDVAIKVLPRAVMADREFRKRFEREARAVGRLRHDSIVQVHDFGEEDGQPYIVMEHMAGGSLAERLARGPLAISEALNVLTTIAAALDAAHAAGIIHRDLKPGNILFDDQDRPHVADFGISRLGDATTSLTHATSIGTPPYMSPEQCEGTKELASTSDIYSLGIVTLEMLTGRLPFRADSPWALMRQHIQDEPPLPSSFDSALAPFDSALLVALEKEPGRRPASARLFAAGLCAAVAQYTHAATVRSPRRSPSHKRPPRPEPLAPVDGSWSGPVTAFASVVLLGCLVTAMLVEDKRDVVLTPWVTGVTFVTLLFLGLDLLRARRHTVRALLALSMALVAAIGETLLAAGVAWSVIAVVS